MPSHWYLTNQINSLPRQRSPGLAGWSGACGSLCLTESQCRLGAHEGGPMNHINFKSLKQCIWSMWFRHQSKSWWKATSMQPGMKARLCYIQVYSKYLFALGEAHWPVGKTWTNTATKHKSRTRELICKFSRKRIHMNPHESTLQQIWINLGPIHALSMEKSIPWYPGCLETFQHIFAASDSAMGHTLTIGSVGSWMNSQLISIWFQLMMPLGCTRAADIDSWLSLWKPCIAFNTVSHVMIYK